MPKNKPHKKPKAQSKASLEKEIQQWKEKANECFAKFDKDANPQYLKTGFIHCKKAADAGDNEAQCLLWNIVIENRNIFCEPEHQKIILEYLEVAVQNGERYAIFLKGCYHKSGFHDYSKDLKKAFELFKQASDAKSIAATFELANCYMDGLGTPADPKKAFILFSFLCGKSLTDIALQSLETCIERLGHCLENGIGCTADKQKAIELYRDKIPLLNKKVAANLKKRLAVCLYSTSPKDISEVIELLRDAVKENDAEAAYDLAKIYEHGHSPSLEKNMELAYHYYRVSADLNLGEGFFKLGLCLYSGTGVKIDKKLGIENVERAAKLGILEAQVLLGEFYLRGTDKPKNSVLAVQNFKLAATAGSVQAKFYLGRCLMAGNGIEKNEKEGLSYLNSAAEALHLPAMGVIARFHLLEKTDHHSKPAYDIAFNTFQKIYKQDSNGSSGSCGSYGAYGLLNLGLCYLHGIGTSKNADLAQNCFCDALTLLMKQADKGDAVALNNLGWCHLLGLGIPQDHQKAIVAFTSASEKGSRLAENSLGWCHLNGFGVAQDARRSLEFFQKSEKVHFGFGDTTDEGTPGFLEMVYYNDSDCKETDSHIKANIQLNIAQCMLYGLGTHRNRINGINILETILDNPLDENTKIEIEIFIAICYFNHWTAPEPRPDSNNAVAFSILKKFQAKNKNYFLMTYLGLCKYYGVQCEGNKKIALKFLQKANAILETIRDPQVSTLVYLHDYFTARDPESFAYHAKTLLAIAYAKSKSSSKDQKQCVASLQKILSNSDSSCCKDPASNLFIERG